MSDLLLPPLTGNPNARFHENLPSSFGEGVGAAFRDPLLQPGLDLAPVQQEIVEAEGLERPSTVVPRRRGVLPRLGETQLLDPDGLTPLETPEKLNEEFGPLGLKFDRPTRRGVAEILAREKREERIRQDVLSRAPSGALFTTASLGASFAAAALDPLNVAAAFVPVAREGRLAGAIARLGTVTRQRLATGALEGAVGNAAIEPAALLMSEAQQRDYTYADALLNITLGAGLGAGFRFVGGVVGDRLSAQPPAVREAAGRAAIAQMAEGRRVDVDPILRERAELGAAYDRVLREGVGPVDDPLVRISPADLDDILVERGPGIERPNGDIEVKGRALARLFGTRRGYGLLKIIWDHGERAPADPAFRVNREDVLAFPDVVRQYEPSRADGAPGEERFNRDFVVERDGRKIVYGVSRFQRGDKTDHLVTVHVNPNAKVSQRKAGVDPESPSTVMSRLGDTGPETLVSSQGGREPTPVNRDISTPRDEINEIARREADPRRDATADFDAADRADVFLADAPREWTPEAARDMADRESALIGREAGEEANFEAALLNDIRGLLGEDDLRMIDSVNDMLARAEDYAAAVRAAGACLVRA